MTTVADIAKEAYDGIAAEFGDNVVKAAVVTKNAPGAYTASTGVRGVTATSEAGRAIFATAKALAIKFPAYVAGPGDLMVGLEGFLIAPEVNDTVTIESVDRTIVQIGDIAQAGDLFDAVIT